MMKSTETRMKATPGADEIAMFARKVLYPIGKAERLLGYTPQYGVEKGIELSLAWLRHEAQLTRKD